MNIKGILFDYGGTIDTNGLHWAVVMNKAYQLQGIDMNREVFNQAFGFGERALAINPLVKPHHHFRDMLAIKIGQQFQFLVNEGFLPADQAIGEKVNAIADYCNILAVESVNLARPVLEKLAEKYPLVMVSNFYGNLHKVLETFDLHGYFNEIVESAVVGVRKPNPAIYQLGVTAIGLPAADIVVIGDSYSKDIVPGKAVGCKTIWLKKEGWGNDPLQTNDADWVIGDFQELLSLIG